MPEDHREWPEPDDSIPKSKYPPEPIYYPYPAHQMFLARMRRKAGAHPDTSAAPTYVQTVMAMSPLGFWSGDTSGTVAHDEVGANPGTYINSPTLNVTGLVTGVNTAVTLNGTSQLISIPDSATFDIFEGTHAWTIKLWVSHVSDGTDRYLWHKTDDLQDIQCNSSNFGTPNMKIARSDATTVDQAFPSGQLVPGRHLVIVSFTGTQVLTYVDDTLFNTLASTRTLPTLTGALRFGAYSASGNGINGTIDKPAVWDRVLTGPERTALWAFRA